MTRWTPGVSAGRKNPKDNTSDKTTEAASSLGLELLDDPLDLALVGVNQIQQDLAERMPHGLVVPLVKVDALEFTLRARNSKSAWATSGSKKARIDR